VVGLTSGEESLKDEEDCWVTQVYENENENEGQCHAGVTSFLRHGRLRVWHRSAPVYLR
jgi:hypothetical protein